MCDAVVSCDARDPVATRAAVLAKTGCREADLVLSCVNVDGAELAAIFCARDRGVVYFFAMSTSFTRAALGAEGVGKDVDLMIGNGYARGHADHTLDLLRATPALRALFERRYGEMQVSEVRRLRELEAENARLKRLLAERDLELDTIRDVLRGK